MMDEEVAREQVDEEFEKRRAELRKKDEEKTGKNRKRREKAKKKEGRSEDKKGETAGGLVKKAKGKDLGTLKSDATDKVDAGALPATSVEDVGVMIHDDD